MNLKLLVVLVVVLVLAFAGALVLAGDRGEARAGGDQDGLLAPLLERFDEQAGVTRQELSGSCGEIAFDGSLVFGGSCALEVAASDQRIRRLRLVAVDGLDVEAPTPGEGDGTVAATVEAGESLDVAVGEDGGVVELDCGFLGDCRVRLEGVG